MKRLLGCQNTLIANIEYFIANIATALPSQCS